MRNDEINEASMICGGVESVKLAELHTAAHNRAVIRILTHDSFENDNVEGLDITPKAADTTPEDSIKVIRKSAKKYSIGDKAILANLDDSGFTADDGAKNIFVSYDADHPKK